MYSRHPDCWLVNQCELYTAGCVYVSVCKCEVCELNLGCHLLVKLGWALQWLRGVLPHPVLATSVAVLEKGIGPVTLPQPVSGHA